MKNLFLCLFVLGLIGCESAEEKKLKQDTLRTTFLSDVLKKDLIDPSSLQLQNLRGYCGEANSKNRFGGYVGFKKFIVLNKNKVIFESEHNVSTKQFPLAWESICKEEPKFNDAGNLIEPNFKLPDAVYDPPKLEANGKTIVITPSSLTMDRDFNYIYPSLVFRCDEERELDVILLSFRDIQYSDGYYVLVTNAKNDDQFVLVKSKSSSNAQSFTEEKTQLLKFLKQHDFVRFAFKASDGGMSVQSYDLVGVKQALKDNKLKCNW